MDTLTFLPWLIETMDGDDNDCFAPIGLAAFQVLKRLISEHQQPSDHQQNNRTADDRAGENDDGDRAEKLDAFTQDRATGLDDLVHGFTG